MFKKLKYIVLVCGVLCGFLGILFFFMLIADEEENNGQTDHVIGMNLSPEVLAYQEIVKRYAQIYGVGDYLGYLLAIMQVESGGKGNDVMQCSESLGLPPNTLMPDASIAQGCKFFSELLAAAKESGCDSNTAVQSYNYGKGYMDYVSVNGSTHTFELAQEFSRQKSGGRQVPYSDPIAVQMNGGWRYGYGNMFYVLLIQQYLPGTVIGNETFGQIMAEALKYQGWQYVFGGSNPDTSFDCSGLTQWCYGTAGIPLPRTAQEQYDQTQHLSMIEAEPGDLVFFQGTYSTANYITHVGIYVGENRMYDAGDPIGYTDLTSAYWQQHLVGAGRIK